MLYKSDLMKILKSRRSIIFIALIIIIPLVDLALIFNQVYFMGSSYTPLRKSQTVHPALASFLSGSSIRHIPQMLLCWILPLYLMLIYSDLSIQERMHGYNAILSGKINRINIIKSRMALSFSIPAIVCFISLLLNFALSNILFFHGKDLKGMQYSIAAGILNSFEMFCLLHPNFTYFLYIIGFSFIAGGCGILCTSISILFSNYKIAYPLVFFIWFAQIIYPLSLTYAMQPFIEYGPNYFVPAIVIFIAICSAFMLMAIIKKVKCDEI